MERAWGEQLPVAGIITYVTMNYSMIKNMSIKFMNKDEGKLSIFTYFSDVKTDCDGLS